MSADTTTRHYCAVPAYLDRFDVDQNGCWIWNGPLNSHGYAAVQSRGSSRGAHREMYLELVGPIPEGLTLDHLCRVRHCVNPGHLEPVTVGENSRRSPISLNGINHAKTHCVRGHEFTPENIYLYRGKRHCRACMEVRKSA